MLSVLPFALLVLTSLGRVSAVDTASEGDDGPLLNIPPKFLGHHSDWIAHQAQYGVGPTFMTNAKRMAMGMKPKAPRKLYKATKIAARQAMTSNTPVSSPPTSAISATYIGQTTPVGYLAIQPGGAYSGLAGLVAGFSNGDTFNPAGYGQQQVITVKSSQDSQYMTWPFLCAGLENNDDISAAGNGFAAVTLDDITNDPNCPAMVWDTISTPGPVLVTITNGDGTVGNPNVYYDSADNLILIAGSAATINANVGTSLTEADRVQLALAIS